MVPGLIDSPALVQVLWTQFTVPLGQGRSMLTCLQLWPWVTVGQGCPWPHTASLLPWDPLSLCLHRDPYQGAGNPPTGRDWMEASLVSSQLGCGLSHCPGFVALRVVHSSYLKTSTSPVLFRGDGVPRGGSHGAHFKSPEFSPLPSISAGHSGCLLATGSRRLPLIQRYPSECRVPGMPSADPEPVVRAEQ